MNIRSLGKKGQKVLDSQQFISILSPGEIRTILQVTIKAQARGIQSKSELHTSVIGLPRYWNNSQQHQHLEHRDESLDNMPELNELREQHQCIEDERQSWNRTAEYKRNVRKCSAIEKIA